MSKPSGYSYFRHDNAVFRGDSGRQSVSHVLHDSGWSPYEGDRMEPVMFGSMISEHEAHAFMSKPMRVAAE